MSFTELLDLVFPRFCINCGDFGKYICRDCERLINFYDPQTCPDCEQPSPHGLTHPRCQKPQGLEGMFVLGHYDGIMKDVIHRVKYEGQHAVLADIADVIGQRFQRLYDFDYLVPVPLAKKRQEERGFNQARKLAEYIDETIVVGSGTMDRRRENGRGKVVDLLVRTRETKPQFELKYHERKKNVADAFSLTPSLLTPNLSGLSFCLVDDVATTGATIFECAKVLKRAGADEVFGVCLARGG